MRHDHMLSDGRCGHLQVGEYHAALGQPTLLQLVYSWMPKQCLGDSADIPPPGAPSMLDLITVPGSPSPGDLDVLHRGAEGSAKGIPLAIGATPSTAVTGHPGENSLPWFEEPADPERTPAFVARPEALETLNSTCHPSKEKDACAEGLSNVPGCAARGLLALQSQALSDEYGFVGSSPNGKHEQDEQGHVLADLPDIQLSMDVVRRHLEASLAGSPRAPLPSEGDPACLQPMHIHPDLQAQVISDSPQPLQETAFAGNAQPAEVPLAGKLSRRRTRAQRVRGRENSDPGAVAGRADPCGSSKGLQEPKAKGKRQCMASIAAQRASSGPAGTQCANNAEPISCRNNISGRSSDPCAKSLSSLTLQQNPFKELQLFGSHVHADDGATLGLYGEHCCNEQ